MYIIIYIGYIFIYIGIHVILVFIAERSKRNENVYGFFIYIGLMFIIIIISIDSYLIKQSNF